MNGYLSGSDSYGLEPSHQGYAAGGRLGVNGYDNDAMNNYQAGTGAPRFSPNADRRQSSSLADLKDPIQVHLLTETALTDSKAYEILSQEEVDDLKKQIQHLSQRIQQARTNLTIQTKYRDAAISMTKLYSPGIIDGARRSSILNRNSGGGSAVEAELERQASEKKCEELAKELHSLEKSILGPQRRLLEHTAGILQLTHKASKRKAQNTLELPNYGIPGSPESLYTFSNGRNSVDVGDDNYFGERGLYQGIDSTRTPPMDREQNIQLREEHERLQELNVQLKAQKDALSVELDYVRREESGRLADAERRLETLSRALGDVMAKAQPDRSRGFEVPSSSGSGEALGSQLDFLERGLTSLRDEQDFESPDKLREAEAASSLALARVDALNAQFKELLLSVDAEYPDPPVGLGAPNLEEQFDYSEQSIRSIESELARAADVSASNAQKRQDGDQTDAVLQGLWDIIQSGFADIQQRKEQRRRTRIDQGLEPDEDDMSGDESIDVDEPYSLSAFSTKVQWLYAQATTLKEQKSVLKRQIKQQRELNSKSDTAKDAELQSKQTEVDQVRELLTRSEQEAHKAQSLLSEALKDAEDASTERSAIASDATQARDQLREQEAKMAALEKESQAMQARVNELDAEVQELDGKLNEAEEEAESLRAQLADAEKAAEEKQQEAETTAQRTKEQEDEIEKKNMALAELKTELTIAQAELDGAYGSRKERAVEAAAIRSTGEVEKLKAEVEKLKDELASTLKELEGITAETIGSEREKLEVEGRLDEALAARASLELELTGARDRLEQEVGRAREEIAKLQEELDAERLKAVPTSGSGAGAKPSAGASMLSEQFRATMKQERKKFQEDLREEQAKRRKLEEEVQRLRKAAGPGKSPLSPR